MRTAVIGAGAMGAAFAAEATEAGGEVCVVDVDPALVEHINTEGIVVESPDRTVCVPVRATVDPEALGPVDLAVVFVKGYHTPAAAQLLALLQGAHTVAVTLQNGWGNAELLASVIDPDRLIMGVTYQASSTAGPGYVRRTGSGPTVLGPYLADADLATAERVAAALSDAGWPAEVSTDVRTEMWKKLVLNAATLPTAAVTGLAPGELARLGSMRELVNGLAAEAVRVARAQGLAVDAAERIDHIHSVLADADAVRSTMRQDVEGRRKTEIETVNGAIVAVGAQLGVETPLNRAVLALVQGLEQSWSR